MDFPGDFEGLSVEQLAVLIEEFGPLPALLREMQAKSLMRRVPGLRRLVALLLATTTEDGWQTGQQDPVCEEIVQALIANGFTTKQLLDVEQFCSPEGLKSWKRAVRKYLSDPSRQGVADAAVEALLDAARQGEAAGDEYDPEEAEQVISEGADRFDNAEAVRNYLRDEFGLESRKDYLYLMDAMKCTIRDRSELWKAGGEENLRQITKLALSLAQQAKAYPDCTPSRLRQWQRLKRNRSQMNPNAIYKRPTGDWVWGDMKPVIWVNGEAHRPMSTLFGVRPVGSTPSDVEMHDLIERAFPEKETEE